MFVVFGLVSIGTLASPDSGLLVLYLPCTLAGLVLLLAGIWEVIAKQKYEREYAKLLAGFKQNGTNEAVYEKIMLHLNRGKYQGQLNVATAPPETIRRYNEVISIRYYALLNQLKNDEFSGTP